MKVGTDFSGIGSPEMALEIMGIDHEAVFACEIDKYARQSYEAIHQPVGKFYNDITTRDHSEVPQLDLYVAGFPCQAFSMAGKRQGFEDTRGTLFFNVAEFIKENQPKCFILENVKGLLSHDSGKTFQTITSVLSDNGGTINGQISIPYYDDGLGYHIYWQVLNTKKLGIPQNRERIFIVGFKEYRAFSFPKPFPLKLKLKDMLQDNPDSKYYLSDGMIDFLENYKSEKFAVNTPLINDTDTARSINARTHKMGRQDNYLQVPDKYYLSDKAVAKCERSQANENIRNEDIPDESRTIVAGYHKIPFDGQYLKVPDKYYLSDEQVSRIITDDVRDGDCIHNIHGGFGETEVRNFGDESPKIRTPKGGGHIPSVVKVKSATNKGYEEAKERDSIDFSVPESETRRGRVGKEVAQTLDTACNQGTLKFVGATNKHNRGDGSKSRDYSKQDRIYDADGISETITSQEWMLGNYKTDYRIRRLTPLECWRLQAFPDEAFFKAQEVCSDTQLYKQAGNSISVNVMVELFKCIFDD